MRFLPPAIWQRSRRSSLLVVASASALGFLVPASFSASTAQAAPSPGYTASYLAAGTGSPEAVAVNTATDTVYLGDSAGDLVVIDGTTNSIVTTLTLAGAVSGLAVDSATNTVYAVTAGSEVTVINGATNAVSTTIPAPAGVAPENGIAVDSTTDQVYVTDQVVGSNGAATGGGVFVIGGGTDTVVSNFSSGGGDPLSIAVDETTNVAWVTNTTGTVTALNATTGATVYSVSVADNPRSVAVDPATDTVYIASSVAEGGLTVIDGSDGVVTTNLAMYETSGVAVDSADDVVFVKAVAPGSTTLGTVVIDGTTNDVVNDIGRFGNAAVDAATGSVYETASASDPGLWVITPSAADAMSPIIETPPSSTFTFTIGTAGSFTFSVSALPAATFSETGQLPSGITLSSLGILSGTAAAGTAGSYPITITASNGVAPDYSEPFTLEVAELPTVTVPPTATVQVGTAVSIPIQVTGVPAPTVQVLTTLPPGVELTQVSPGSWELTGTPAPDTAGVYPAEFYATNAVGTSATSTMVITVLEAPSIAATAAATFQSDAANSYTFVAECNPACTYGASGLPAGLNLNASGLLTGDLVVGTYNFTVTASNNLGAATQEFTLTVQQSFAIADAIGELTAEAPQLDNGGWYSLGGTIFAAPAVVSLPTPSGTTAAAPLFIGTGVNGELYLRTATVGWQPVGPSKAFCIGAPAAAVTGTTLTVACEGTNGQLYYDTAAVPASGLPQFSSGWKDLGGALTAGPAVAPVDGVMTFFALGTDGRVYTRTLTTGFKATSWLCIGNPAAATDASTGVTTFACQGTNHALWKATDSGTGWSGAVSLGGTLTGGGPAVAAGGGVTEFFAEGTNNGLWMRTPSTGWVNLEEGTIYGVGAGALN